MQYFVSSLVCLTGERARCFTFIVLLARHVAVIVLCLFLYGPWAGLQCVIVAFPGHTHILFAAFLYCGVLCYNLRSKICVQRFYFFINNQIKHVFNYR